MPDEPAASIADTCPCCGQRALRRDRVRSSRAVPVVDALRCSGCGEWWFESGGGPLKLETLLRLGLDD